jgi:hypothetical protein
VLADSPLAYWRLGESGGSVAADSSGNGHSGTYVSNPTVGVPGALVDDPDTAVEFSGVQGVSVNDGASAVYNSASVSAEAWVQTIASGDMAVMRRISSVDGSVQFALGVSAGKATWTGGLGSACTAATLNSSAVMNDGLYHHVVGTYDVATEATGVMSVYIDGVETSAATSGGPLCGFTDSVDLSIAANGAGLSDFDGVLDEIAVYGSALPAARVTAHFSAGAM